MNFKNPEEAKKLLRKLTPKIDAAPTAYGYGCGIRMLAHINPTVGQMCVQHDEAIEWLAANDPQAPKTLRQHKIL